MPAANQPVLDYLATRLSHPAKAMSAPVPSQAEMEAILSTALRTPDHGKLEPWRLVLIDRPAMIRLADLAEARVREAAPKATSETAAPSGAQSASDAERIEKGRGQFDRGTLAVAVISSPKPSEKIPMAEQILSAGALCMNILHAATAAGWGANWLTGWPSHDAAFAARAFGCTGTETVAGIIHIGTPNAPMPDRPRPDLARILTRA